MIVQVQVDRLSEYLHKLNPFGWTGGTELDMLVDTHSEIISLRLRRDRCALCETRWDLADIRAGYFSSGFLCENCIQKVIRYHETITGTNTPGDVLQYPAGPND